MCEEMKNTEIIEEALIALHLQILETRHERLNSMFVLGFVLGMLFSLILGAIWLIF